jgi:hypothetical protein
MHRASRARVLASLGLIASLGCGSTTTSGDGGAPLAPNVGAATIGPIDVAAGAEETVCIFKRLNNAEDIMATSFVADLAPGSHHLILYKSTQTVENFEPVSCVPFLGLIDRSAVPIMLVNKRHMEYVLPPNVGMVIEKGQMLKIEAHYINATSAQIEGLGTVTIQGVPLASAAAYQKADFSFWGTTAIDVPPMSTFSTAVNYVSGLPGTKVSLMTTHQHRLGTRVQVWLTSPPAADGGPGVLSTQSTPIIDEHDWSNPALTSFDPPIAFDGSQGLSYQCSWSNMTDQRVQFGESALNEMCFVGMLYYPSHGFDMCLDGDCRAR